MSLVYDDQGRCIARLVNGEVFSEANQRKFATVREGHMYGLDGKLIGHLQDADLGLPSNAGSCEPEVSH
jgi:hypothetical protein